MTESTILLCQQKGVHGIWNTGSRVGQNIELYPVKRFVFTTPVVVNQIMVAQLVLVNKIKRNLIIFRFRILGGNFVVKIFILG